MNIDNLYRSTESISEIYVDGDVDYVFFGQIISCVTSYTDEDGEEEVFEKTSERILEDALMLAEYLINTGDFSAGRTINEGGSFHYALLDGGFDELRRIVTSQFEDVGIDDIDLRFTTWLRKNEKGKKPEMIPHHITELFS